MGRQGPRLAPPLKGSRGRRRMSDGGKGRSEAGGRQALPEGKPKGGRNSEERTPTVSGGRGNRRGRPSQVTVRRSAATGDWAPIPVEGTLRVRRGREERGTQRWMAKPGERGPWQVSPGEPGRCNKAGAQSKQSRMAPRERLEVELPGGDARGRRPPPWPPPTKGSGRMQGCGARHKSARSGERGRGTKGDCVENITVKKGGRSARDPHLASSGQTPAGRPGVTPPSAPSPVEPTPSTMWTAEPMEPPPRNDGEPSGEE